ncbi:hypothetical protein EHYA_08642 [Embleya hyalina]|uniref:Uncharacterized protein n=1 Tax=Embleya hyalina TaxID=516124 RepID=A0A401Z1Z8_9ACTN|nr:hypothetical protein EHYA_08642 [Embleya hyalina]
MGPEQAAHAARRHAEQVGEFNVGGTGFPCRVEGVGYAGVGFLVYLPSEDVCVGTGFETVLNTAMGGADAERPGQALTSLARIGPGGRAPARFGAVTHAIGRS